MNTNKKNIFINLIKALASAYALLCVFNPPLENSAGLIYYIKESFFEIFDVNNLLFVLLFAIFSFFYIEISKHKKTIKGSLILSIFFACCLLLGVFYRYNGTLILFYGSLSGVIKTILCISGYAFLFDNLIYLIFSGLDKLKSNTDNKTKFWKNCVFIKTFAILMVIYLPFIILSYPGNMCYDAEWQIYEMTQNVGFTLHHPLINSIFMGGIVKIGQLIFGSYNNGTFLYIIVQDLILAAVFSYSLSYLSKKNINVWVLRFLAFFFAFNPVIANFGTTVLKDMTFTAFTCLFMVFLAKCLIDDDKDNKKWIWLCIAQILVIWFRNNGLHMLLLSDLGIIIFLFLTKKKDLFKKFLIASGVAIVLAVVISTAAAHILHAEKGSRGEMLSLPFQQTARYVRYYRDDLTEWERMAIVKVLGNPNDLAIAYDYGIADPVKAHFRIECETKDIVNYMIAWAKMFPRHPGVYIDAFLVHVYGWFDPGADNYIRYEFKYDNTIFEKSAALDTLAQRYTAILIMEYDFAPTALLANMGFWVWGLFLLALYQKRNAEDKTYRMLNLPLWISLLICMAAPAFYMHPRYGFPILFAVPFLYGVTLCRKE